jgi:hypothetical protein
MEIKSTKFLKLLLQHVHFGDCHHRINIELRMCAFALTFIKSTKSVSVKLYFLFDTSLESGLYPWLPVGEGFTFAHSLSLTHN